MVKKKPNAPSKKERVPKTRSRRTSNHSKSAASLLAGYRWMDGYRNKEATIKLSLYELKNKKEIGYKIVKMGINPDDRRTWVIEDVSKKMESLFQAIETLTEWAKANKMIGNAIKISG